MTLQSGLGEQVYCYSCYSMHVDPKSYLNLSFVKLQEYFRTFCAFELNVPRVVFLALNVQVVRSYVNFNNSITNLAFWFVQTIFHKNVKQVVFLENSSCCWVGQKKINKFGIRKCLSQNVNVSLNSMLILKFLIVF